MQYMNNMCNIQAIPSPISGSTTTTFLVLFVRAARVPSAVGTPDKGSACAIRRPCGTFLGTPRNFCATRHRRESESEVDGAIPPIYKSYEEIQQPLQWHQSELRKQLLHVSNDMDKSEKARMELEERVTLFEDALCHRDEAMRERATWHGSHLCGNRPSGVKLPAHCLRSTWILVHGKWEKIEHRFDRWVERACFQYHAPTSAPVVSADVCCTAHVCASRPTARGSGPNTGRADPEFTFGTECLFEQAAWKPKMPFTMHQGPHPLFV